MVEQLERGQRVGEYVVDGLMGAGAFGSVYRGIQPVIGKLVAIKVLHRQDPETTARFINEARAVNAIQHPNLVDIFAFGQLEDGRPYLVMEWLQGEPLDGYLERIGGHIAPEALLAVLEPLARALDAAHGAGIIHRDLKPSNVFLTVDADGALRPKLLDFGIAKLVDDESAGRHATGTGRAMGTPEYMSPEQCQGPDIDHRTDVYAFGAMLFRMMTGSPVFSADTAVELMMKQMKEPARRPSTVLPSLPRDLDAVVLGMLDKDPKARPESLKAAVSAFRAALEEAGLEIQAPPKVEPKETAQVAVALTEPGLTAGQMLQPPQKRGGLFAGIAALVLCVAALPFLLDFGPGRSHKQPAEPAQPKQSKTLDPPQRPIQTAEPAEPRPEPKKTVKLFFKDLPDGTMVLSPSGSLLTTVPIALELPRGSAEIELRFEKAGFLRATAKVRPTETSTISVKLRPIPKKRRQRPPKKPDKDSVEDPY